MKTKLYLFVAGSVIFNLATIAGYSQLIGAGSFHSMALCTADSIVRSWGGNSDGQLGINDTIQHDTAVLVHGPVNIGDLNNVIKIVTRENFSLALKSDGTVWAWGYNGDGELGDHSTINRFIPVPVHGPGNVGYLTGIVSISAGYAHVLALKNDGTVWAWGDNVNGELGNNSIDNDSVPVQVRGAGGTGFLTGITAIAAGQQFSLALKNDSTVWAWGLNDTGQLGDNTTAERHTPIHVHGPANAGFLSGITALAAGGGHSLALTKDSTVYSWGFNINGELGNNGVTNDLLPALVYGPGITGYLSDIVYIKAGDYFSGAIMKDSTVWVWGFNGYGQLGENDTVEQNTPIKVHDSGDVGHLKGVKSISLGDEHVIAYKYDGSFWAWGWNGNGQLGDGTTTDRWTPVRVIDPCNVNLDVYDLNNKGNYEVSLFPNPNNGKFSITINGSGNEKIVFVIYNVLGQQIFSAGQIGSNTLIDISNFTSGVYFYRASDENHLPVGEGKLIKN